jgi:hypothetical protein
VPPAGDKPKQFEIGLHSHFLQWQKVRNAHEAARTNFTRLALLLRSRNADPVAEAQLKN